MAEYLPVASCPWAKSKCYAPWIFLAWLVTTTTPVPRTPLCTLRRETFLLQPAESRIPLGTPCRVSRMTPNCTLLPSVLGNSPSFFPLPQSDTIKKITAGIPSPKSAMGRRIGAEWQCPFYREVNWGSGGKPSCLQTHKNKRSHVWSAPVLCSQPHNASLEGVVHGQKEQRCSTLGVYTTEVHPKGLQIWCRPEYRSKAPGHRDLLTSLGLSPCSYSHRH